MTASNDIQQIDSLAQKTRFAFLAVRLLNIPFWTILSMLSFILYKDMHITPLQVTTIIALKPLSAIFAPYWSLSISHRRERLVPNIISAMVLQYTPFLFFPWIDSPWLMIFAFSLYMMLNRGIIPAWMEIFKQNLPPIKREWTFSFGSVIDYCGGTIFPILLGILLDNGQLSWRWLFPITAIIGLCAVFFLSRIPMALQPQKIPEEKVNTFKENCLKPWIDAIKLLKERRDFSYYTLGFMLGGAGLMVMQPALPMFFVDVLNLSYTKMFFAISVCKGIGFTLTSPIWTNYFHKSNIFFFSGLVTLFAFLFPFFLMGSQYQLPLLYFGWIIYGIMQAGSELSWHMSGPVFANEGDSAVFSRTNVLMVGIRGCIFPFLGSAFLVLTNPMVVMVFGAILCLLATQQLWKKPARSFGRSDAT